MAGKFVIITAKNGEFTFNLKASNGEVILTASETYTTMSACENGIASVKTIPAYTLKIKPEANPKRTRSMNSTRIRPANSAFA